jgi:hypothetical protein
MVRKDTRTADDAVRVDDDLQGHVALDFGAARGGRIRGRRMRQQRRGLVDGGGVQHRLGAGPARAGADRGR